MYSLFTALLCSALLYSIGSGRRGRAYKGHMLEGEILVVGLHTYTSLGGRDGHVEYIGGDDMHEAW